MTVDEPVDTPKPRERPSSRCPGCVPTGKKLRRAQRGPTRCSKSSYGPGHKHLSCKDFAMLRPSGSAWRSQPKKAPNRGFLFGEIETVAARAT